MVTILASVRHPADSRCHLIICSNNNHTKRDVRILDLDLGLEDRHLPEWIPEALLRSKLLVPGRQLSVSIKEDQHPL
jgi:hypothetical protein